MIISLHYNGAVSVELKPENEIEATYVKLMVESAGKGRAVTLASSEDGSMTVSVPK